MPTSPSACWEPSSGRPPGSGSGSGCCAASAGAGCSTSPGTPWRRAATGRPGTFRSDQAHGLLAPWVLHTGLGPENAVSGFMTQVIACAVQLGGMPVPVGGGVRLVEALSGIVRDAGGELRTDAQVESIVVSDGRATGVVLSRRRAGRRDEGGGRGRHAHPAVRPPPAGG